MSKTIVGDGICKEWHAALKKIPGWWFKAGEQLIRVRRVGRRFVASVYEGTPHGFFRTDHSLSPGRGIIGNYRTVADARESAEVYLGHRDEPKLTTWADVERDRKAIAALEKAKATL
jgi:hypothetical protein